MAEKQRYELKANVSSASIALANGKSLRLEGDASFETSDPAVIADLEGWDAVKRAEAPAKAAEGSK